MQIDIELELDQPCWMCDRTGTRYWHGDPDSGIDCPQCEGTGWALTDQGVKIIDFLNRHSGRLSPRS
jgi:hypothetical protein